MQLSGKRIAILAADGFEHSELYKPLLALRDAGAQVDIVSIKEGEIKSWRDDNWADPIAVTKTVNSARAEDYDGLVLPGGVINPDRLRADKKAVQFVRAFFKDAKQKPVAAICHGPWMLAEADVLKNRTLTSYSSIRTDLENAGAKWQDSEVIVDKGLVTSRSPHDLPVFIQKMLEEFSEAPHSITQEESYASAH